MANKKEQKETFFKYEPGVDFKYRPKAPENPKTGAVDEDPVAQGAKVDYKDLSVARGAKPKS